jgi:SlyX protein
MVKSPPGPYRRANVTKEPAMPPEITPDTAALARRIEALEMDAAHRGQVIDDLNAALLAQWKEIDGLKRQLARLSDQLSELEMPGRDSATEPPPPHY